MAVDSIHHSTPFPFHAQVKPPLSLNKIKEIFTRGTVANVLSGLAKSRILRTIVITVLTVGFFSLIPGAPLWLVAATTACIACVCLFYPPFKGLRQVSFELLAPYRLATVQNYNEIQWGSDSHPAGKIYLGGLPNQLNGSGTHLVRDRGVAAVLSVNEPWEREVQFLSVPYSEADWEQMGVDAYKEIDVVDTTPLEYDQMDAAADYIHENVSSGKNIYVHCRAGHGRSAMAVAAYLIKHQHKSPQEAASIIKTYRRWSTIQWKMSHLIEFQSVCQKKS